MVPGVARQVGLAGIKPPVWRDRRFVERAGAGLFVPLAIDRSYRDLSLQGLADATPSKEKAGSVDQFVGRFRRGGGTETSEFKSALSRVAT